MKIDCSSPARCLCGAGDFVVLVRVVGEDGRAIIRCRGCGDVFLVADGQAPQLLESRGKPVAAV